MENTRISKAFKKEVKQRIVKKGDLVLVVRRPRVMTHKTIRKFNPKWDETYAVESIYSN